MLNMVDSSTSQFRRIASSAIVILLLILSAALASLGQAQGGPSVTIGSRSAVFGDNITLPVIAKSFGNSGIGSVTFLIDYDPNWLAFIDVKVGKLPAPSINSVSGRIIVLWYDSSGRTPLFFADDDILFSLNFKVSSQAGGAAPVVFGTAVIGDVAGNTIPVNFVKGIVIANGGIREPIREQEDTPQQGAPPENILPDGQDQNNAPPQGDNNPPENNSDTGGNSTPPDVLPPPSVTAPSVAPWSAPSSSPSRPVSGRPASRRSDEAQPPLTNNQRKDKILGFKTYADGALLRGSDKKIYIIENQTKRHVKTLAELRQYAGRKILDVANQDLIQFPEVSDKPALAEGSLLRSKAGRIYVIESGKKRHINSLTELRQKHAGQRIFDVGDDILAQY